jgi:hypothetical protein
MNEASAELPEWPKVARMGPRPLFGRSIRRSIRFLLEDMMAARYTCTGPSNRCVPAECPPLSEPGATAAPRCATAPEFIETDMRTLKEYVWKTISARRTAWRLEAQRYEHWSSSRARGVAMS